MVTAMSVLLLWLHLDTLGATEDGFISLSDDLNVVISSPDGKVLINGVDLLGTIAVLATRMKQLESEVSSLNAAV
jgi:hypothetical protein